MSLPIKKIALISLASAGVLVLLLAGAVGLFLHHFNPDPPAAHFSKPADALEAQRQDLSYFRTLMAMDRSFDAAARAEVDKRLAALESLGTALPRQRLQVALMQTLALSDNGHTLMGIFPKGGTVRVLPVRATAFADGIYVLRAKGEDRDLLGGRVESVDGRPIDAVMQKLETLRGGLPGFRLDKATTYLVVSDLLYGLGIAPDADHSVWTVRRPDGTVVTRSLTSYPLDDGDTLPDPPRWMSPEPLSGMGTDWLAYSPASGELPESLQKPDTPFIYEPAGQGCAAYLRMRAIADDEGQKIGPAIAAIESGLRARPPCALILDLRYNRGGNFQNSYDFMHALPGLVRPQGDIYVLTDAMTFSAAITTTAFLKQAGGDRVKILGEPVGDRLSFYAEGGGGCLPNSRLCMYYATGKHDYAHACTDLNRCYWLLWFYPVRVESVAPDVPIPSRFADWNAGHDLAYETALALADQMPRHL